MHNVYLFQPQYQADVKDVYKYWLPYGAGCVWSYAEQFDFVKENFQLDNLFFSRLHPDEVLNKMTNPRVCGFGIYNWNERYCLDLARRIKERWPNCHIVVGGASATGETLKHEFVDSVIISEGEEHFTSILKDIVEGKTPQELYAKKRIDNLDIPSPYLSGTFDKIIAENPDVVWAMTFETNRGCPFECIFCNWGGVIGSDVRKFNLTRVEAEVEWAIKNPIGYMFVADANFGAFKERDVEIARMIRRIADEGQLKNMGITYTKNSSEVVFIISTILGDISNGVTLSLQSANDTTLTDVKRKNLDGEKFKNLMRLSDQAGVPTYTEMILGLPDETIDSWKTGLTDVLEMGQHSAINIWPCQIFENTELSMPETKQRYGIETVPARDYLDKSSNRNDYKVVSEYVDIVKATNTMTTEDIVEGFMYGWMIVHFHTIGYSQLYAKYARNILNISYREFYDKMFEKLVKHEYFGPVFKRSKGNIEHYMEHGEFVDKYITGHSIVSHKVRDFFDNSSHAYDIGLATLKEFTTDTDKIDEIQRSYIFGRELNFPITVQLPWDIDTWELVSTEYEITSKINLSDGPIFYNTYRKGLLKNHISRV